MDAVRLPVMGAMHKGYILLNATCKKDYDGVVKFFQTKKDREKYNNRPFFIQAFLSLPQQHRTVKQNNSAWKLITTIFESVEGRLPLESEKKAWYYDLLELYADKVPNRLTDTLRPIHLSEANAIQAARFIDGLIIHLATLCELNYEASATVQSVLEEHENRKGLIENDPADYRDKACTEMLTHEEWMGNHPVSQASGRCGQLVRAHIVSRGSDAADIEKSWNWMALLWEEHQLQHQIGWDSFLQKYPHLRKRVNRARKLAKKPELEYKASQKAIEYKPENLAAEALEV